MILYGTQEGGILMFKNKEKLESIKKILQFQNEMINRVTAVRETEDMEHLYEKIIEAPNGYQVEYIDNIGIYTQSGRIEIWKDTERQDEGLLYAGVIDEKRLFDRRPFVIGRMQINGDLVEFPRLDREKLPNWCDRWFTNSEEDLAQLQYLLEETKVLTLTDNQYDKVINTCLKLFYK